MEAVSYTHLDVYKRQDNALLDARSGLYIGKNVNLSSNVSIYTLQHNYRSKDFGCDFDKDLDVYKRQDKDNVFVSFKTSTVDQMSYVRNIALKYENETQFGLKTRCV